MLFPNGVLKKPKRGFSIPPMTTLSETFVQDFIFFKGISCPIKPCSFDKNALLCML